MDTVLEIDDNFDFTKLSLGQPQPFQGGSFFTKISYNGHDLQIQFPKCKTKQGINQTEKKYFTDLLYDTLESSELTAWLETLESTCQKLIFNKRDMWFHSQIELNDIETAFTNSARLYKSGKQFLVRCHFNKLHNNKQSVIIYDEDEKMLNIQDVTCDKDIIPLIRIDGIKFSTRSFQIEYNLTQIMVLREQEEISHCMIKHNKSVIYQNSNTSTSTLGNLVNIASENNLQESTTQESSLETNKFNLINNQTINSVKVEINKNDRDSESIAGENLTKMKESENTLVNMNSVSIHNPLDNNKSKTNTEIVVEKQNDDLEPVEISFNEIEEEIKLRKPNEVYYEIYRAAREKAKLAKIAAIEAYLEAKSIKTKYMLEDLDESFEDESEYLEELSEQ